MSTRSEVRKIRLAEWEKIFKDRVESGLNITKYCEAHNLSRDSYYYWQNLARTEALSQMKAPALVELKPPVDNKSSIVNPVVKNTQADTFSAEAILTVNDVNISINSSVSKELLAMVLEVLSNA